MNSIEKIKAIVEATSGPMRDAGITFQPNKQIWRDSRVEGWDIVPESTVAEFVRDVLDGRSFEYTESDIEAVMPRLRLARAHVTVNFPVQPIEARPRRQPAS